MESSVFHHTKKHRDSGENILDLYQTDIDELSVNSTMYTDTDSHSLDASPPLNNFARHLKRNSDSKKKDRRQFSPYTNSRRSRMISYPTFNNDHSISPTIKPLKTPEDSNSIPPPMNLKKYDTYDIETAIQNL